MPSPTFPISSYLTSNSLLSSHSSSSSTLSESSNSISTPILISTKRSRGPRKRPNQCSAEAAALLSSIYPKLFCVNNQNLFTIHPQQIPDDPFPLLIPNFPISNDSNLPYSTNSSKAIYNIPQTTKEFHFQDPGSPDFDAESILDEEVEEGIDSIMGNLSMTKDCNLDCLTHNSNSLINLCGSGFGISSNILGAFRKSNDGDWWRYPKVSVKDIVTNIDVNLTKKKKKKKKKSKMKVENEGDLRKKDDFVLKAKLGLKLNYQGIIEEWTGDYPFDTDSGILCSASDLIASLAEIDESRDGGMREASVQRYKEKRRNRLFSKKIRYEVRKTNANHRPRIKGRFIRGPILLEAMAEESHEMA